MFNVERSGEETRKLSHNNDRCVGCGICTDVCPTSSLRLGPIVPIARGLIEMDLVSVTSNAFGGLKGDIDSCEDRMRCLKEFFKDRLNYTVMVLDDAYGTTVFDDEFDAIVVSEETEPVAVEINEIRDSKGMSPLDIVVVSFVLADDGHPISSTRIRSGEINKKGNILK